MNTFTIAGNIDESMLRDFYKFVEKQDCGSSVCINISSDGGDSDVALAIAGIMKTTDIKWTTQAFGYLYSASLLIFAAGTTRRFSKYAFAMIHETQDRVKGSSTDLEAYASYLQRYEKHWNRILEECTGTEEHVWAELSEAETYLDANQAKELNLATEII